MATIKVFGGNEGWLDKEVSDDMANLVNLFDEAYKYIYERNDDVDFYKCAVSFGDELIRQHHPLVAEFNTAREEPMLSDREVAAFAIAASELGMV